MTFKDIKLKNLSRKALLSMLLYVVCKWTIIICFGTYLYKHGLWKNEYFLFFPLLAIIVWWIRGIRKQKRLNKTLADKNPVQ